MDSNHRKMKKENDSLICLALLAVTVIALSVFMGAYVIVKGWLS